MRHLLAITALALLNSPVATSNPAVTASEDLFNQALAAQRGNDHRRAREILQSLAVAGHPRAQSLLGFLYLFDNPEQARRWLERAANAGDRDAQFNLGNLYRNGRGGPVDYGRALGWFVRAANAGDESAQLALGELYEEGLGVRADGAQARHWYEKAAGQEEGEDVKAFALEALRRLDGKE